jgi:hypothetical protein
MFNLCLSFSRVSSLQNDRYTLIPSGGTIDYPPPPSLLPPTSQDLELRGFHVYTDKYVGGGHQECTQQDYYNMQDWGMTVCRQTSFWGASIEPDKNQPGIYSTILRNIFGWQIKRG